MSNNFNWEADRQKRAEGLDRIEAQLGEVYASASVKEYPDANKRIEAFEKTCKKMASPFYVCHRLALPFILYAPLNSKDLALLLRAACLRVTSIKPGEERVYLSLDDVFLALTELISWQGNFLELSREQFNKKWAHKPFRIRAIADQIRRDLTGLIGEFFEHRHNCNDFKDFFSGFRNGLLNANDPFDFRYKREGVQTEVKTANLEGKLYIFSNTSFEGDPKFVLLGLVRFENEGAIWEGGIKSTTDILKENPTFEPFRKDKTGRLSAIEQNGIRPNPDLTGKEPFRGYYGVRPLKNNTHQIGGD